MHSLNMAPTRPARTARSFISKLAAAVLVVLLALGVTAAPLSPLANEDAVADEANPVTSTLKMATPNLPLADAALASENQAASDKDGKHTMTFYYLEMVLYDDPEFSHPSNLRLLYTRTVEGLNVGDQLDTWDYVDDIDGYCFFDAYPAKPVVGEDDHLNGVEVWYGNLEVHQYTVNTYHVSDGANENVDIVDPHAVVEDINGQPVRFQKIDSEVVSEQYFNKKIVGDELAGDIEHMEYLGSYPESIRVQTDYDQNVINLLYTDNNTTLPDAIEVPSETFGTEPDDANSADGDTDNSTGAEADAGSSDGNPPAPDTGSSTDPVTTPDHSGAASSAPDSSVASDSNQAVSNPDGSSSVSADEEAGTDTSTDNPSSTDESSHESTESVNAVGPEATEITTDNEPTSVVAVGDSAADANDSGHRTELVVPLPQTDDAQGNLLALTMGVAIAAALAALGAGMALRRTHSFI